MSYPLTTSTTPKPRLLLFIFLPLTFAAALLYLSRPAESTAKAKPVALPLSADTIVETNASVVGNRVRLAISVSNVGPDDEPSKVSVLNTLPDGMRFASFSGRDWSCQHNSATRTTDCQFRSPLLVGQRAELILLADKDQDLRDAYINITSALGSVSDPVLDNNSVETELFYLGREFEGGIEIDSSPTEDSTSEPASGSGESTVTDGAIDGSGTDGPVDNKDGTGTVESQQPILPKTGTNLTAFLVTIGTAMAVIGRLLVEQSERAKMLARCYQ